jgi:hypothetical protein
MLRRATAVPLMRYPDLTRRRAAKLAGACSLLFLVMCGIQRQRERAVEADFRDVCVEGYSEFRVHASDFDAGGFVFSYQLPATTHLDDAGALVATQIEKQRPCFRRIDSRRQVLRLRCPQDGDPKKGAFEEFQVAIVSPGRRAVIAYQGFESESERSLYDSLLAEFESRTRSESWKQ